MGRGRVGGRGCTRQQGQRKGQVETGGGPHSTFPASTSPLYRVRQYPPVLFGCLSLGPLHGVHQKNGNHPCGQVVGLLTRILNALS